MIPTIPFNKQLYLTNNPLNFKQQLEDIVTKIEITSDLTITCGDTGGDFEPLKVPSRLQEHLKQVQIEDCDRYLAAKLQKHLYIIFSELNSNSTEEEVSTAELNSETVSEKDSNYVNKWSRTQFYQQLTLNNHGQGYGDPDWLVIKQTGDYWQVTKSGLTIQIKPSRHLIDPSTEMRPNKLVTVKMPPNLVDRGIYIAVGNSGLPNNSERDSYIIQLYFHVNSKGALSLLDNLTDKLNAVKIPFSFKLPYSEAEFDNYDTAILEFYGRDCDRVYSIVNPIYQQNQDYFQLAVPFFCQYIAPGFGLAQKPMQPNFERENIGQHHCSTIAKALITICHEQEMTDSDKLSFLFDYISQAGIDLTRLYLNPHCTKIYSTESE